MPSQRSTLAAPPFPADNADRKRGELRGSIAELIGQARQIGRFGTADQIEKACAVLDDAKRQLYAILAAEPSHADTRADSRDDPAG